MSTLYGQHGFIPPYFKGDLSGTLTSPLAPRSPGGRSFKVENSAEGNSHLA